MPEALTIGNWGRRKSQGIANPIDPQQVPIGTDLAGQTVQTNQGDYVMRGASSGATTPEVPFIRQGQTPPAIQPVRQTAVAATPENPLINKGEPIKSPNAPDQREVDIMVKKAKNETLTDDDLRFLAQKEVTARAAVPTIQDIQNMTADERLAYQQKGFQDTANQQLGQFDEFGQAQQDVYDKRIADAQAQMEAEKAAKEGQNAELLKAFEDEQRQAAEMSKQEVIEAGQEGMGTLQRSAARRGMTRSSATEGAIAKATANTQKLVSQIELATNSAVREYQVDLLDKLDLKMEKLQDRVTNLGDLAAEAELSNLKDKQKTYVDLMTQDPSNPQNMLALADKLKEQELAEIKENRELQKDAAANLQWAISTSGSAFLDGMSDEQIMNLAGNTGMNPSVLRTMGKTLKEQENEWDKLKYFDTQDFQYNLKQMDYAQQSQRDALLFDQDIAKLQATLAKDMSLEDFKSSLEQAKDAKARGSVLSALGVKYNEYADSGDSSGVNFPVPVPHPSGAGEVVSLNAQIAQAYPDGYRFKAADGAGGLGGQCKWFAEKLTTWPDGSNWTAGSTLADTKKNFDKYYKAGKAFKVGEEEVKPGMAVLSSDSKTYGHGYVINAIQPDGKWVVTESNYKGPLTVSNSRVVDPNDPKVIGVLKTVPAKNYQITGLNALGKGLSNLLGQTAIPGLAKTAASAFTTPQQPEVSTEQAQPETMSVEDWQVQAFNDLPAADKKMVMESAPEFYQAVMQKGAQTETVGRPLDMSTTTTLSKFNDVSAQLKDIETQYNKLSRPDPITGAIAIKNPYDADVQQLNRMITAVVPTLARGVFGEVGVLTDSDVERYTKLLADARTPKDQAQQAMDFLQGRVKGSYANYLDTFRRAGYDVSGFADQESSLEQGGTVTVQGPDGQMYQMSEADAQQAVQEGGKII